MSLAPPMSSWPCWNTLTWGLAWSAEIKIGIAGWRLHRVNRKPRVPTAYPLLDAHGKSEVIGSVDAAPLLTTKERTCPEVP